MIQVLRELFQWPDGIVVGNLIASALWATPAIAHLDRLARKHHQAHMAQLRKHCPGCTGHE